MAEYDFRYNARTALGFNDPERSDKALRGIVGKRLTYGGAAKSPPAEAIMTGYPPRGMAP